MYFLKLSSLLLALLASVGLQAQCTLTGTVFDEEARPMAAANVVLLELQSGSATDADGAFVIEDVPAGTYTLSVSYLGYTDFRKTITIPEGVTSKEVDIRLQASGVDLGEVTVQATRANERTPMTFVNLDKEDLEVNNLGQDVPYLLRWTPSAVVTSDAGTGVGYTGIRIRGTDPTRINVTINGIPLNDAESQGVFWVNMPDFISSTSDVQIQRGVGTSTNGAGAFGATINLNTSRVQSEPRAQISASAGSFNTFKRNVQFSTGLLKDHFTIDGRLSKITSDGYIDRASADMESYYLSGAYVSDRTMLRFNTFSGHEITYQAWNGVPAELVDDWDTRTFNSAGTEKPGEPYEDEVDNYRQTHYQLLFNQELGRNWNTNVALHYTQGQGFFEQYKADQDLAAYGLSTQTIDGELPDLVRRLWLDNDFYGGVYGLNLEQDGLDFTLGGGFHVYEGGHFGEIVWSELAEGLTPDEEYYNNDARKVDVNVFGRLNYELLPGLRGYLDLQFRQVDYSFLGLNRDGASVDQNETLAFFNPKAGLQYAWDERTSVYASFAVANREPNRNDYVESTPDSRPDPEQLLDTEVGFKKQFDRGAFEAVGYYMFYNDQLVLNGELNDVGAATRINVDKSYRLGLELVGGYQLTDNLDLQATMTLSRNKIPEFRQFVDVFPDDGGFTQEERMFTDTDLSFSPDVIAAGEITWHPFRNAVGFARQDLSVSLLSKYVGQQFLDNTSDPENVIDPYFFSDIRLRYALDEVLTNRVEITLLVQNIFNAMYETNGWSYRYLSGSDEVLLRGYYPQAGRNFLAGITLSF
jgi:iron complex outermembrane recepter protein